MLSAKQAAKKQDCSYRISHVDHFDPTVNKKEKVRQGPEENYEVFGEFSYLTGFSGLTVGRQYGKDCVEINVF